jgi:hypothetical protein
MAQHADKYDNDDDNGFACECGFVSAGHSTKRSRDARLAQHRQEHETGEPMPELAVFRGDVPA